jgi:hypothetical protein
MRLQPVLKEQIIESMQAIPSDVKIAAVAGGKVSIVSTPSRRTGVACRGKCRRLR